MYDEEVNKNIDYAQSWKASRDEKLSKIVDIGKSLGENPDQQIMSMLTSAYLETLLGGSPTRLDDLASGYQLTGDPFIQKEMTNTLYGQLGVNPIGMESQETMLNQFKNDFPLDNKKHSADNARYLSLAQQSPQLVQDYYADFAQDKEDNNFLQNWFNNPNSKKNRAARMEEILNSYTREGYSGSGE